MMEGIGNGRVNLPIVPIHDLTIKGTDMVAATHGRSFWILDDLTPLHQLMDGIGDAPAHLFAPRPTVRMRVGGGSWGDEVAGMANYDHAATSIITYLPVKKNGQWTKNYLNGGTNPPNGVIIQYYLAALPESLTLEILDDTGAIIRTYAHDALAPVSGSNRFVWDMRYDGAAHLEAEDLNVWQRDVGPMVLPGTYRVRLRAGDHELTQQVEILRDPRIAACDEDLRTQHDLLLSIRDRLSDTNRAIAHIRTVRGQVAGWEARLSVAPQDEKHAAVLTAGEELTAQLAAVECELIDVLSKEPTLFPIALNEKWNALFDHVDSADYVPTQNAHVVFGELSQRLDMQLAHLRDVLSEEGNLFNRAIVATGATAIDGWAQNNK